MATTIAIAGVVASLAATGVGAASASGAFSSEPKAPKPPAGPDPAQLGRQLLPGAKADAAARSGGGFSPDFLANMIGTQAGNPDAGLGVLGDIRNSLGGGGGIQSP